jgi:CDP-glucose 4,6-dehydratase
MPLGRHGEHLAWRRIFLTGHTCCKGGWMALWLAKLGAQVRGYSLDPSTSPNLFTVAEVSAALDDVRGDILDRARLEASMADFAPQVVFHLAAPASCTTILCRSAADLLNEHHGYSKSA